MVVGDQLVANSRAWLSFHDDAVGRVIVKIFLVGAAQEIPTLARTRDA